MVDSTVDTPSETLAEEVKTDVATKTPSKTPPQKATSIMSGAENSKILEDREKIDELLQVSLEPLGKADISASTLVKMMGVASATELKLIEGKLDLLSGRIGNLSIRLERVLTQLANIPAASDFERLESQITLMRSMLKDLVVQKKNDAKIEDNSSKDKLHAFVDKNRTPADTPAKEEQTPSVAPEPEQNKESVASPSEVIAKDLPADPPKDLSASSVKPEEQEVTPKKDEAAEAQPQTPISDAAPTDSAKK